MEIKDQKTHLPSKRSCLFCGKGAERASKALFLQCPPVLSWIIFAAGTQAYRMFFQQKLFVQGGCCSLEKGTAFLTATTDLEDKYGVRAIIPEKQLSYNYAGWLFPSEKE